MAKRLKSYQPFEDRKDRTVYPWDIWFDGSIWEIPKDDVPTYKSLYNFRIQVLNQARQRGLKVQTHYDREREVVVFQVISDE